jgi:hypothetical protein
VTARPPLLTAVVLLLLALFPATAGSAVSRLDIRANVRMVPGGGATLLQEGSFSGAPLGRGRVRTRTRIGRGRGSVVRFVMTTRRGTVSGTGDCSTTFKGSNVSYACTASITAGTGAYRRMRGRGLRVTGRGSVSSERWTLRMTGRVRT